MEGREHVTTVREVAKGENSPIERHKTREKGIRDETEGQRQVSNDQSHYIEKWYYTDEEAGEKKENNCNTIFLPFLAGLPRTGPKTFQNQKNWTRTSSDQSFEIGAFFQVIVWKSSFNLVSWVVAVILSFLMTPGTRDLAYRNIRYEYFCIICHFQSDQLKM